MALTGRDSGLVSAAKHILNDFYGKHCYDPCCAESAVDVLEHAYVAIMVGKWLGDWAARTDSRRRQREHARLRKCP